MTLVYSFRCPLPQGLHARPASLLAEQAAAFSCSIELVNERTGAVADAASVLSLVSAGVMSGDPCRLELSGPDAQDAMHTLSHFIAEELPGLDEPVPELVNRARPGLPRSLSSILGACLQGQPVSPGIGRGKRVHLQAFVMPQELQDAQPLAPTAEKERLDQAVFEQGLILARELENERSATAAAIRKAVLALLQDRQLRALMHKHVLEKRLTAEQAVVAALSDFSERLRLTGSAYLLERVPDLEETGANLVALLSGLSMNAQAILSEPSIVVASHLGAAQFLSLDRELLAGLVLGGSGATSHAAILARSFGIPAVSGIDLAGLAVPSSELLVDGLRGLVIPQPDEPVRRFYEAEAYIADARQQRELAMAEQAGELAAGVRMVILANISSRAEAAPALQAGAEGIGLFRTEMLFTGRQQAPSEEEQFEEYRDTVITMQGWPVTFRTLDIGGDKPVSYLSLPQEENPFLGVRGLRLYEQLGELVDTQLRALLRASAFGRVRIMAPMLTTLSEARSFRERVKRVQKQLKAEQLDFDAETGIGAMIEVPAAALSLDQLGKVLDFFSIGSNDLAQYFFAADRGNPAVSGQFSEREPAFLSLLSGIQACAQRQGLQGSICGEMAGQLQNLPLLVGMGMDVLSVSVPSIAPLKTALARLDRESCRRLLDSALRCESAQEVDALLRQAQPAQTGPMLNGELLSLASEAASKSGAIRELVNLCYCAGRCDEADALEEAVWAREETYSTGLGYGFAIPHCKTAAISSPSLALLRLKEPVEWGSLDGAPVSLVILLAMPEVTEDNQHLKVFAKLARRLMDETFRQTLQGIETGPAILEYLDQELEMGNETR